MRTSKWMIGLLVCVATVSACSSSSKSSSSTTTTAAPAATTATTAAPSGASTTLPQGNDQKDTPFCQTMVKLSAITDPTKDPQGALKLLADAESQAPSSLQADVQTVAAYLRSLVNSGTTTSLSAADQAKIAPALQNVSTYVSAHCGISLPGA